MYIANVLIEQVEILYDGLHSCEEKQMLHENTANKLMNKHNLKIMQAREMPVFFVTGVESKIHLTEVFLKDEYPKLEMIK